MLGGMPSRGRRMLGDSDDESSDEEFDDRTMAQRFRDLGFHQRQYQPNIGQRARNQMLMQMARARQPSKKQFLQRYLQTGTEPMAGPSQPTDNPLEPEPGFTDYQSRFRQMKKYREERDFMDRIQPNRERDPNFGSEEYIRTHDFFKYQPFNTDRSLSYRPPKVKCESVPLILPPISTLPPSRRRSGPPSGPPYGPPSDEPLDLSGH